MLKIEIKREKRRSLTLKVTAPEKVLVKAPTHLPEEQILQFVHSKEKWIQERSTKLKKQISFFTQDKILYLGKIYQLQTELASRAAVLQNEEVITVQHLSRQKPREQLDRWYKNKARTVFEQISKHYCQKMAVQFDKLRLSSAKTRWGSCSSLGNINLNWNLIKAPKGIIAYVVAHELTHLHYPHHGKSFWHALEEHFPRYKEAKQWLNKNGGYLVG